MSETADRVKKIVVEHLGVEADKVTEDASFIDDLGADSLDIVELVMAFEEEFGVEIPDDAAEKITTVNDAITYIDAAQGLIGPAPWRLSRVPETDRAASRPRAPGPGSRFGFDDNARDWRMPCAA